MNDGLDTVTAALDSATVVAVVMLLALAVVSVLVYAAFKIMEFADYVTDQAEARRAHIEAAARLRRKDLEADIRRLERSLNINQEHTPHQEES